MCAQITHAAGESGARYQDSYDGRFSGATAVVLEVKDEKELESVVLTLFDAHIPNTLVYESSGPYAGQLMAIGVVPGDREKLSPSLSTLQTLKTCLDNPPETP